MSVRKGSVGQMGVDTLPKSDVRKFNKKWMFESDVARMTAIPVWSLLLLQWQAS